MAVAEVQKKNGYSNASSNDVASGAFTASTAGNLIVLCTANDGGRDVSSITPTGSADSFTQATNALGSRGGNYRTDVWYKLSTAGSLTAVTITYSGSAGTYNKAVEVYEFSGFTTCQFDLADHLNDQTAGVGTVCNGKSITTTGTGCVVGLIGVNDGITLNPNTGNEFSSGGDVNNFGQSFGFVSLVASAAGAHQPIWGFTNANGDGFCTTTAAFKEAAVGDTDTRQTPRGLGRGLGRGLVNSMSQLNGLWRPEPKIWVPGGLVLA